ncbi:MAG: hypothetical protein ACO1OB_26870 [Archangium sp.]
MAVAVLALSACPAKIEMPPPTGGGAGGGSEQTGGGTGGGGVVDTDGGIAKSAKARVRFKGNERFAIDLAVGLGLPIDQVCKELGQYDCAFFVHGVALGGVEPYGVGLYEPPQQTGATTALAVERVVLSACAQRLAADVGNPATALIYRGLPVVDGKLSPVDGPEVRALITDLAQRAWLRDPTAEEVESLIQLARDIEPSHPTDAAAQWGLAACFTVFSSAEAVFY